MKYLIAYLLVGIIMQIMFVVAYIINKSFIDEAVDTMSKVYGTRSLDEKEKRHITISPKSIFLNIIRWPFNIAMALCGFWKVFK